LKPLNDELFSPIAAEDENDNPLNIIFIFHALKQNSALFEGLYYKFWWWK